MKRTVTARTETVFSNTTLPVAGYGGWMCMNIGNADVDVDGYRLEPGEKLDAFATLSPDVVWNSNIVVVFSGGAGALRVTRLQYS